MVSLLIIFFILFSKNLFLLMYIFFIMLSFLVFCFFFFSNYSLFWVRVNSWIGWDKYRIILVFLSLFIVIFIFILSFNVKDKNYFGFILMLLLIFLVFRFSSINYFIFYLFFEISIVPTFLLILGWGYQPERLRAGIFIFLYTIFASLPLLVLLFSIDYIFNSLRFLVTFFLSVQRFGEFIVYFYIFFAFFVKLPLFIFHIWLPKAHVEAPVVGSMILAGVILKLGGYGLIRFILLILDLCKIFNFIFFRMCLFSITFLRIVCLRQLDIKVLVAYSSVVHMGVIILGLIRIKFLGYFGGFFLIIGHGICSSGLFIIVNFIYERVKSRLILLRKGLLYLLPTFCIFFFIFCVGNIASPPTLNLLRELLIINILLDWSINILFILIIGIYLRACYSLYLFSFRVHGYFINSLSKIFYNFLNNYILIILHLVSLNFLFLKMDLFV